MTPLIHAMEEINYVIPEEILQEAFGSTSRSRRASLNPTNIEYAVREKVLNGRVIQKLNLQSQRQVVVENKDIMFFNQTPTTATIKVSKKALGGCSIVTPLAVMYSDVGVSSNRFSRVENYNGSEVEGRFNRLIEGHRNIENVQNANLSMVGPNTVFIDNFAYSEHISLKCTITHDPELLTLPKGYWDEFATLCVYAVQSFCFHKLRFIVASAKLSGGMELSVFKEVLEEYRDSEKMFKELLDKFRKYDNLGNAKAKQVTARALGPAYHL